MPLKGRTDLLTGPWIGEHSGKLAASGAGELLPELQVPVDQLGTGGIRVVHRACVDTVRPDRDHHVPALGQFLSQVVKTPVTGHRLHSSRARPAFGTRAGTRLPRAMQLDDQWKPAGV